MTLLLLLACHAPKDAPADSTGRDSATDSRPTESGPTDSIPTDATITGGTGTTPTDTGPDDADGDGWPAWDDCDQSVRMRSVSVWP